MRPVQTTGNQNTYMEYLDQCLLQISYFLFYCFGAKIFARITLVQNRLLWPMIFAVSVCGTYSLSQSITDVWIMLIFGVIGFYEKIWIFSCACNHWVNIGWISRGTLRQSLVILGEIGSCFSKTCCSYFFYFIFNCISFPLIKRKN